MKTHHPEIKKDPLYQEALYKVYKNNPELIESQQKSNAEKKQRLNAIKINKICMAFSILYVLFMALIGTLLNENFWYEMGIGMGVVLVAKEAHFIITDIISGAGWLMKIFSYTENGNLNSPRLGMRYES